MIDELNRKILAELESHGFRRPSAFAAQLGLAERTIYRRIDNLRRNRAFVTVAIPNFVLVGYRAMATIGIKVKPGTIHDVLPRLVGHRSTYFVANATGEFDILVDAIFETFEELTQFLNSELVSIHGVARIETILMAHPRKYYRLSWPANDTEHERSRMGTSMRSADSPMYHLDRIDRDILDCLIHHETAKPAVMKSITGLSETTINKRKKRMLDSGVFVIQVVPNPAVLNYGCCAMIGVNVEGRQPDEIVTDILHYSSVYFAATCIGKFNVDLATRFQDLDSLNNFTQVVLPKVEGVSSIQAFLYSRPLKYHGIDWSNELQ